MQAVGTAGDPFPRRSVSSHHHAAFTRRTGSRRIPDAAGSAVRPAAGHSRGSSASPVRLGIAWGCGRCGRPARSCPPRRAEHTHRRGGRDRQRACNDVGRRPIRRYRDRHRVTRWRHRRPAIQRTARDPATDAGALRGPRRRRVTCPGVSRATARAHRPSRRPPPTGFQPRRCARASTPCGRSSRSRVSRSRSCGMTAAAGSAPRDSPTSRRGRR